MEMIILWQDGAGRAEMQYNKETGAMHYTLAGNEYIMTRETTSADFEFPPGTPVAILAQQEMLNDGIFECTNWLNLQDVQ